MCGRSSGVRIRLAINPHRATRKERKKMTSAELPVFIIALRDSFQGFDMPNYAGNLSEILELASGCDTTGNAPIPVEYDGGGG